MEILRYIRKRKIIGDTSIPMEIDPATMKGKDVPKRSALTTTANMEYKLKSGGSSILTAQECIQMMEESFLILSYKLYAQSRLPSMANGLKRDLSAMSMILS